MNSKYDLIDDIKLIESNKLLFKAYKLKFKLIKKYISKKNVLEIGSGSGIASFFLKNVICSDVRKSLNINIIFNAYEDKLKKKINSIILNDVFHHLHRPNIVIKNLRRSLKKEGHLVMLEPYLSPVSYIFYIIISFVGPKEKLGFFKKVDLSLKKRGLKKQFDFVMQPQKFFKSNSKQKNVKIEYISEYFFIFTGGLSFHKLQKFVPKFIYNFLLKFDKSLNESNNIPIKKFFATKMLIVLK
jgi:SAM-dependent methyltransferase